MSSIVVPETVAIARPDQRLMRSADDFLMLAQSTYSQIQTSQQCEQAAEQLKAIKARAKDLEDARLAIIRPLLDAQRAINELFRGPEATLAAAEAMLKRSILAFQDIEEGRRRAAQVIAAEALRREREKLEEKAAKAEASGGLEKAQALRTSAATLPLALPQPVTKLAGLATKSAWRAEVTDKAALVRYLAEHPEWLHLVEVNITALNGLARSQKAALSIPGVRTVEEKQIAARRA